MLFHGYAEEKVIYEVWYLVFILVIEMQSRVGSCDFRLLPLFILETCIH